ncbi:AmmeMemoRadiSam system protein A [Candidatus Gottesmanbacteria bacterium]|nr:AmmeMemoRadiSam system protein A [Candidatus Gottesmanbacteria bacterium]
MKDFYVNLAKNTVEEFVRRGKIISPPDNLPTEITQRKAGTFVSIHKKLPHPSPPEIFDGLEPPSPVEELRGCIGTYLPTQKNIGKEIVRNAIDAATCDPRFPPISKEELPHLIYSVDILSEPEPTTKENLDPKKYGVIIQARDGRRGLLLPDLPGVDTVDQQISICRQKAWIAEDEPVTFYRFTVERHGKK